MITLEESQEQQSTPTYIMSDHEGGSHVMTVEARALCLDGDPADIVAIAAQQISFATKDGTIACPVDAFGEALLGGNTPTSADLGQQLGQNLARWYAQTRLVERLRAALREVQATLDEYEQERPELLLPQMRLDPYMVRVLESYKGTEESAQAIALVLDRPIEQIRAMLAQAAVAMRALVGPSPTPLQEKQTARLESTETLAADSVHPLHRSDQSDVLPGWITKPESKATEPQPHDKEAASDQLEAREAATDRERNTFRWEPDLVKRLKEEVCKEVDAASESISVAAVARAVAERCQWPYKTVDYKIRTLGLVRVEPEPSLPETLAFISVASQEQEEVRDDELEMSGQKTRESVAPDSQASPLAWSSSSLSQQEQETPTLEIGHTLWDVVVNGRTERWLLDYAYGAFPFTRANSQFIYRGRTYDLDRAYTSKLKVTVPVRAEVLREAAGVA
ncbi:MAG: hypothetical protein ACRDIV_17675 [Ktedonobacteraceae bacterium]